MSLPTAIQNRVNELKYIVIRSLNISTEMFERNSLFFIPTPKIFSVKGNLELSEIGEANDLNKQFSIAYLSFISYALSASANTTTPMYEIITLNKDLEIEKFSCNGWKLHEVIFDRSASYNNTSYILKYKITDIMGEMLSFERPRINFSSDDKIFEEVKSMFLSIKEISRYSTIKHYELDKENQKLKNKISDLEAECKQLENKLTQSKI